MIKMYKCWTLMDEDGNSEETWTLELWNSSTKHPDSKFYFNDFELSPWVKEEYQIFQWLLECASKLDFPFFAKELTEYALANWVNWEDKK